MHIGRINSELLHTVKQIYFFWYSWYRFSCTLLNHKQYQPYIHCYFDPVNTYICINDPTLNMSLIHGYNGIIINVVLTVCYTLQWCDGTQPLHLKLCSGVSPLILLKLQCISPEIIEHNTTVWSHLLYYSIAIKYVINCSLIIFSRCVYCLAR